MATAVVPAIKAPTWSEWCAHQQDTLRDEQRREQGLPFSERQMERLSFVRWLYLTGRLGPQKYDNE